MNYIETSVPTEDESKQHFALKIQNDIWGIPKGALLVCQEQSNIEENKIMVLQVLETFILAKFKRVGELYIMNTSTSANPKTLTEQQLNEILSGSTVLGKAINYSVEC